jgi:hypothetical protein
MEGEGTRKRTKYAGWGATSQERTERQGEIEGLRREKANKVCSRRRRIGK